MNLSAVGAAFVLLAGTPVLAQGAVNASSALSYVGKAAYDLLSTEFSQHRSQQWDLSSGKVIGDLHYTPLDFWNPPGNNSNDPVDGHSDWFPKKMGEILSRTTEFADVMSLSPPDGEFLEELKIAMQILVERATSLPNPIVVRLMFGHIISEPVNVTGQLESLTEGIAPDANIQLWVGAWRDRLSWNHAKMIAVDGKYLHTGGHNMWDSDYLRAAPVHDLSFELEGEITANAHEFANWQWDYVANNEGAVPATIEELLPPIFSENAELQQLAMEISSEYTIPPLTRASFASFPPDLSDTTVPPQYDTSQAISDTMMLEQGYVPMIGMGKQGTLLEDEPSEDAFVAMFDAAQNSIKAAQQDLGPRILSPQVKFPFPGFSWPEKHLSAFGRALYRGVDVELVLSNPGALELGGYSNGWSCNEVASQIIRTIPRQFAVNMTDIDRLKAIVGDKLRVTFLAGKFGNQWNNGLDIALHTKHFIIDDICAYVGSENLYAFDLAEWGVVVDNANQTRKMLLELWDPMWESSFTGQDCDLDEVLRNLVADSEMSSVDVTVDAFLESVNNTNVSALFIELLSGQGPTHAASNDTFTVADTEDPTPAPTHNISTGDMATSPTLSPTDASGATRSRMFEDASLFCLLSMAVFAFLHL